jgi:chemotaxis protein CheD
MPHIHADEGSPSLYFDAQFEMEAAKIQPGEYYVSKREMVLVTVLGSCVSACIWDSVAKIGGMNHFMLPNPGKASTVDLHNSSSARYGVHAMEIIINQLIKSGARKQHLKAKVFGGANVMESFQSVNVGERNAVFVRQFLKTEGIQIVAEDLLDLWPRKIYFFPQTGRVLVKKLKSMHNTTIIKRETEYMGRLETKPVVGDIDLF